MRTRPMLHAGIATLSPLRVVHRLCLFTTSRANPDRKIRPAFRSLREWVVGFGLDPDTLLHIGIPELDGERLLSYDCCIEFPLPIDEEDGPISTKCLAGGRYAVLRMEKVPAVIRQSIRCFRSDYIPENRLTLDPDRPVYEFYYRDTMEYCVPLAI